MANNMKTTILFLLSIFSIVGWNFAQEFKEISSESFVKEMTEIVRTMNKDNFKMTFKKEIYKDKVTNELIASTTGYMMHGTGLIYRSQSDGILVIQTDKLNVVIDSAALVVQLSKPDTSFNPAKAMANFNEESLKQFKLYKALAKGYTVYRVMPENLGEGIIEYYVKENGASIYKMIITYPPANYFSENLDDETLEEPYAILIYEPIKALTEQERKTVFNLDEILVPIEGGRYMLNDNYKQYELYDSRYSTN